MVINEPGKTIALPIKTKQEFHSLLDEIVSTGARRMLIHMLEFEVESYIQEHTRVVDADGHRLVVRNGYGKSRSVTTSCGDIEVRTPRVKVYRFMCRRFDLRWHDRHIVVLCQPRVRLIDRRIVTMNFGDGTF